MSFVSFIKKLSPSDIQSIIRQFKRVSLSSQSPRPQSPITTSSSSSNPESSQESTQTDDKCSEQFLEDNLNVENLSKWLTEPKQIASVMKYFSELANDRDIWSLLANVMNIEMDCDLDDELKEVLVEILEEEDLSGIWNEFSEDLFTPEIIEQYAKYRSSKESKCNFDIFVSIFSSDVVFRAIYDKLVRDKAMEKTTIDPFDIKDLFLYLKLPGVRQLIKRVSKNLGVCNSLYQDVLLTLRMN